MKIILGTIHELSLQGFGGYGSLIRTCERLYWRRVPGCSSAKILAMRALSCSIGNSYNNDLRLIGFLVAISNRDRT